MPICSPTHLRNLLDSFKVDQSRELKPRHGSATNKKKTLKLLNNEREGESAFAFTEAFLIHSVTWCG
jgi:hypothetical protein